MPNKSGLKGFFMQQYDKILLFVVAIALLVSLGYLARVAIEVQQGAGDSISVGMPKQTPVVEPISLANLQTAERMLDKPGQISVPKLDEAGVFAAEKRVACINCKHPIPYDAPVCPFCGAEQPKFKGPDPNVSTARDGIPDHWKRKYNLDVLDTTLASQDLDGDGFTTKEEFDASTDPTDKESYPDIIVRVKVSDIKGRKLPFKFTTAVTMPDGKNQLTFSVLASGNVPARTYWLKEGEMIGQTGFKVGAYTKKTTRVKDPKLNNIEREIDVSTVEVERVSDGKKVTLVVQAEPVEVDLECTLSLAMDNWSEVVHAGIVFTIRGKKYKVVEINKEKGTAIIQSELDGKRLTILP